MSLARIEGKKLHVTKNFTRVYDMLDYAVSRAPEKGTWYVGLDGSEEKVTYKEQKKQALGVLATLQKLGIKQGDCIIAEVAENKAFHILMWACFYGGIVVTALPRPDFSNIESESIKGFKKIWESLYNAVIITDAVMVDGYKNIMKVEDVVAMDTLYSENEGVIADIDTHDTAYIQYSSGSTGNKKGAMLSNENLICASCNIVAYEDCDDDERPLMWLPHTHNFGAFTFTLLALVLSCDSWSMGTEVFVRNPLLFMQKVCEHRVTRLCMNNLGIQVLLGLAAKLPGMPFDLSALKAIYIGSEKPDPELLKAFAYVYKKNESVFRPGYGMSETVLTVCSTMGFSSNNLLNISRKETSLQQKVVLFDEGNIDDCCTVVEHGQPVTNVTIGIFGTDGHMLEEGELGSIRIQSKTVFKGYYGVESLEGIIEDGWYITGDIGFIYEGKVYITGREKDVYIVRGVNYMLTDLEVFLQNKVGKPGKIILIASEKDKEDKLVAILEHSLNEETKAEFIEIAGKIEKALMAEYGLELEEIVPLEQIKRNASRKVDRYGMKQEYQNGLYDDICKEVAKLLIKESKNETSTNDAAVSLVDVIRNCWSIILGIDAKEIADDVSFKYLGGNSVKAFYLVQKIEEVLNNKGIKCKLNQNLIARCSTVQEMADYIEELYKKETSGEELEKENEVAITGLAFRLPGASNQEKLWEILAGGVDCVHKVSDKRKQLSGNAEWSDIFGEIEDIDCFDYEFFNISKDEAKFMDPQQRLSLEVAYEALDDSGEGVLTDKEKNIAVLAATSGNSYFPLLFEYVTKNGAEDIPETTMVGNLGSTIATRVSHYMNSRGTSLALDSACSSFMVSLLMGERMVKSGECQGALIMGANVFPTSYTHSIAKKAGILSKGNCTKVFDKEADGSLLGEGVVAVYLEGLNHAQKNNKRIYGVIAGGAMNNDGTSLSIMAPNPAGQFDVLKKSYADAGVDINSISYIEAHGTGTQIGDPIELSALSNMFKGIEKKDENSRIPIGSIKSNFGHLLPCAGGAGLIKVLLCMKNDKLVPNINVHEVNPLLEREDFPFDVLTSIQDWKREKDECRYAGISSFGIGGTNAHVIIKDAPSRERSINNQKYYIVAGSAKTEDRVEVVKDRLLKGLASKETAQDISYTSTKGRNHYKYRCAFIVDENKQVCGTISKGVSHRINGSKIAICFDDTKMDKLTRLGIEKIVEVSNGKCFIANSIEEIKADYLVNINDALDKNVQVTCKETRNVALELDRNDTYSFYELLKEIYACGAEINWEKLWDNNEGKIVTLPSYPFAKTSAWVGVS